MRAVVRWLAKANLGDLQQIIEEHRIDLSTLAQLTDDELAKYGISPESRQRLREALAQLGEDQGNFETKQSDDQYPPTLIYPPVSRGLRTAERRLLTVMFCDLVGSSALSTQLDPEDLNLLVSTYRDTCARPIEQYGGFISRFIGDGILVCFGYPEAHEDDAERAIWAGLGVIDAMKSLSLEHRDIARTGPLAVRIGIGTGIVVVGDIVSRGQVERNAIIGEAPNLAARLQALAEPNCLTIANETRRLAGNAFSYRSLGETTLRGFERAVEIWQVLAPKPGHSRFENRGSTTNRLLGRGRELSLLQELWNNVKQGNGQVVALSGEPGIGKSHLCETLSRFVAEEKQTSAVCELIQCSPHFSNTAFYPIIKMLEWAAGITHANTPEDKIEKIKRVTNIDEPGQLQLVLDMLGITAQADAVRQGHSPRQARERTLVILKQWFLRMAECRPLLLIIEDAQWIDPTTRELLDRLVRAAPGAKLLLLVTHRPEFEAPWLDLPHVAQISLNPLDRETAQDLMAAIAQPIAIPPLLASQILHITSGVPLFIEELTRSVLGSGQLPRDGSEAPSLKNLAVPETLHGALLSRIDQLGTTKTIAQLAATIGRDFDAGLLAVLAEHREQDLADHIERLKAANIIVPLSDGSRERYSFRHALIQNAAYESMLKAERRRFHLRIAQVVEHQAIENAPQLEFIAFHYAQAGQEKTAIQYWGRAAEHALARSALFEAANHLRLALDLLQRQEPSNERSRQELLFNTQLGSALRATRGYGAPEIEEIYLKSRQLSQEIGDSDKRFATEWGLMQVYIVKGRLAEAGVVASWLLDFANGRGDRESLMDANIASGMAHLHQGRPAWAQRFLARTIELYRPDRDGPHVLTHGQDPGIFAQGFHHWCLWFLGFPETSWREIETTVQLAKRKSHVFSLVSALTFAIRIKHCLRDFDAVEELVNELLRVSHQGGYEYYEATATVHLGWVRAVRDRDPHGLTMMSHALAALQKSGTVLGLRGLSVELAEGYAAFGQKQNALHALDIARIDGGTHCWDAEVARVHGDILASGTTPEPASAEAAYQDALRIAAEQGALSLQLRALKSLGDLLLSLGRGHETYSELERCIGQFTEGFATKDFRDSLALLKRIEGRSV
jgi:class 3 adenylate cyclase/tetratricopeptide (TPR) repeat protein